MLHRGKLASVIWISFFEGSGDWEDLKMTQPNDLKTIKIFSF